MCCHLCVVGGESQGRDRRRAGQRTEGLTWSLQGTFCDNLEASHPSSLDFIWKRKRWEQMAFRVSLTIYFISLKFDRVVSGGCNVILFCNHDITQMNKTLKKIGTGPIEQIS